GPALGASRGRRGGPRRESTARGFGRRLRRVIQWLVFRSEHREVVGHALPRAWRGGEALVVDLPFPAHVLTFVWPQGSAARRPAPAPSPTRTTFPPPTPPRPWPGKRQAPGRRPWPSPASSASAPPASAGTARARSPSTSTWARPRSPGPPPPASAAPSTAPAV